MVLFTRKHFSLTGIVIVLLLFFLLSGSREGSKTKVIKKNLHPNSVLELDKPIENLFLQTANGCGIGNFLIPCLGDTQNKVPPTIGALGGYSWDHYYRTLDTLQGKQIKGVFFPKNYDQNPAIMGFTYSYPYCVITDTGIFTFRFIIENLPTDEQQLFPLDSFYIKKITLVPQDNRLNYKLKSVVVIKKNLSDQYEIVNYSVPDFTLQSSRIFPYEPGIASLYENHLFITGTDSFGHQHLFQYTDTLDSLIHAYPLSDSSSNPQTFIQNDDSLFLLSSPGDSMVVITSINSQSFQTTAKAIYNQSGARATNNYYKGFPFFTFQPKDSMLNQSILVYNPLADTYMDTLRINQPYQNFKSPQGEYGWFGIFSMGWIGTKKGKWDKDSVFISNAYETSTLKIEASANPSFINATYSCWYSVPEHPLERVEFRIYPNPAKQHATILISGISKEKSYHFSMRDNNGKLVHKQTISAYQKLQLPANLSSGIYLISLEIDGYVLTKKLVIE